MWNVQLQVHQQAKQSVMSPGVGAKPANGNGHCHSVDDEIDAALMELQLALDGAALSAAAAGDTDITRVPQLRAEMKFCR